MLISQLHEQRNKLMTDAAEILRNDGATDEQHAQADKMIADAGALEQRMAKLKKIEEHEAEQRAFVPAERAHVATGTEDARTKALAALRSYMRHQPASEYRDVLTTSASGGATIPQLFYPTLIAAQRDFAPILDIVQTLESDKGGAPMKVSFVNYTNTVLPLVPEGTAFPEIDPAFTSAVMSVDKLGGQVKISAEELEDSNFDLASWLTSQWANVYGVSLEQYVTNGGTTNIAGLVPSATVGATSKVTGAVSYPDVAALFGSLTSAYAKNASFLMSSATRAYLMGLVSTTGQGIFDANPSGNPFSTIFGKPVVIDNSLPTVASGHAPILFGDFKSAYLLRTDGAPTIKRLNERYADTDEVGFIIRTRVGGIVKNAGIAPYVALEVA